MSLEEEEPLTERAKRRGRFYYKNNEEYKGKTPKSGEMYEKEFTKLLLQTMKDIFMKPAPKIEEKRDQRLII